VCSRYPQPAARDASEHQQLLWLVSDCRRVSPPSDFTKLTENQLKNINTLAAKMKELSLAPGFNYSTAISPIPK